MKLKAGMTLVLENGEYNNYSFTGPFRVMRDFDQAQIVETFKAQWEPTNDWEDEEPDADDFQGWLSREGYIEGIEGLVSWHTGTYGRLEAKPNPEPAVDTDVEKES